jgi:hypothetical protein
MKMLTAKVKDGQLDVPKGLLEEGATVTVLIPESDEPFELTPEQRQVIEESIAQIERGEWVDGWALLDEIGSH